jgi:AraC family transcriptional regulator
VSVTAKALWYIESHLDGDISLDAVADVAGVSRFHLSRAFSVSTGRSLAEYARARRLSQAAKALSGGAPDILDVALAAGYGSHEAFTRAFRQLFGVTPEQCRAKDVRQPILLQEPIVMNQKAVVPVAAARLVSRDAFLVVGIAQVYRGSNAGMAEQWNRFAPHIGHVPHQIGKTAYGVLCNTDETGSYEYVCGVEVSQFPAEPAEFRRLRVPPQTYAVFEHREHVSSVSATWQAAWEQGVADAGRQVADGPALEVYREQFDGRTGLGGIEIWIPVKT